MQALEDSIFSQLADDRLTAAMAVARAHMEVAGLAAYCNNALYGVRRSGTWDKLTKLVQGTYFGSSMRIQAGGTPELADYLGPEEAYPSRPGELIKAMDVFEASGQEAGTRFQLMYGLLSEFAHPVMRGNKAFFEVVSETPDGWFIRYRAEDPLDKEGAMMALEIVRDNMRIGYAAATLLDLATVVSDSAGNLSLKSPSARDITHVWTDILQLPAPPARHSE
jgi:hypothetical protein